MIQVAILVLISVLIYVFIQDFKSRSVHVLQLTGIFLMALVINYNATDLNLVDMGYNTVFILINILALVLYFSIKNRSFTNPIDTHIGLGDIVFFLVITPLFDFRSFILFFIFGLLFSLILYIGINWFKQMKTIPLAGCLSLFLIIHLMDKHWFKINTLF